MEISTPHVLAKSTTMLAAHSSTVSGVQEESREEYDDLNVDKPSPTVAEVVVELIHDLASFSKYPTCIMSIRTSTLQR